VHRVDRHAAPHDLLRIEGADQLLSNDPVPDWVRESLALAPLVVVRRGRSLNGFIPVGVRGPTRSKRFAAFISPNSIREHITPEEIAEKRGWRHGRLKELSFAAALDHIESALFTPVYVWGPIGSVAFELASGVPVVSISSDLDLLIRVDNPLDCKSARRLLLRLLVVPKCLDVQLETPSGAIALAEFARCEARLVLRTCDGPRLVSNPWLG
jgi:phosphoribosyl-dephospho-CoA transferase